MRVVDLYCGLGGFSAGAVEAGASVVLGVDQVRDTTARIRTREPDESVPSQDPIPLKRWSANVGIEARATLATLGPNGDNVELPPAADDLHVHASTPCTELSSAKISATPQDVESGLAMLRWAIELVLQRGDRSWSLEQVSTPKTRALLADFQSRLPDKVAYATLDAADFGSCQTRSRLIAGPPLLIQRLQEMPASARLSVRAAFASQGMAVPAPYYKNQTRSRDGTPCMRSVEQQSHTVCSGHGLTWCDTDGRTVKVMSARDSAILMGFPMHWTLPPGSRTGQKAVGNALCVPMARAICEAAISIHTGQPMPVPESSQAEQSVPIPPDYLPQHPPPPPDASDIKLRKRLRRIETKLNTIEQLVRALQAPSPSQTPNHAAHPTN